MDILDRIDNRIHDAPMPTEILLDEASDEIMELRENVIELQQVLIERNFELIACREVVLEYKQREVSS